MTRWTPCHGRSPRWRGFDYASPGWYFVTCVTHWRRPIFGAVVGERLVLSAAGHIVAEEVREMARLRDHVHLQCFVVMPDHLHLLVRIQRRAPEAATPRVEAPPGLWRPPRSLGAMIGCMKGVVTSRVRATTGWAVTTVWQRGYHDRIVRTERELMAIAEYIRDNPRRLIARTP